MSTQAPTTPPMGPAPELGPPTITPRARSREDKAGDPLDGLVNLFDLGIVLAVAFLLAALSSVNLSSSVLANNKDGAKAAAQTAPAGSVIKDKDQTTQEIPLKPGQTAVGQGTAIGTVYQLSDGRTILVRKGQPTTTIGGATTTATPPAGTATPPAGTTTPVPPAGTTTPAP